MQNINVYDPLKASVGDYGSIITGQKFGQALVGTTPETVWSPGGLYVYPNVAGEIMYLSSDDANDADQDTGLWTVLVTGLDEDWNFYSETVILDGLTQVPTKKKFARVWRMQGLTGGTINGQEGSIYLGTSPAVAGVPPVVYAEMTLATIKPNQTQMSMLSVPRGYKLTVSDFSIGVYEDKKTSFYVVSRDPFLANSVWAYKSNFNVKSVSQERKLTFPASFDELTDMEVRAVTETGTENATASFSYAYVKTRI